MTGAGGRYRRAVFSNHSLDYDPGMEVAVTKSPELMKASANASCRCASARLIRTTASTWSLLSFLIVAYVVGASASSASTPICSDPMIVIEAPNEDDLANRICHVAVAAKARLEACHLFQSRPVTLVVLEVLKSSNQRGYLAFYRLVKDRIELTHPGDLRNSVDEDNAYRLLPRDQLFESLIVHEMTHAFFAKTDCGQHTCAAGHEYIAYALQLESMSASARQILLDAYPLHGELAFEAFNDTYLAIAPVRFATNAWRHFSTPGNGCDFIRKIIDGEVEFITDE